MLHPATADSIPVMRLHLTAEVLAILLIRNLMTLLLLRQKVEAVVYCTQKIILAVCILAHFGLLWLGAPEEVVS